jgi:Inward rectifier potassium channel C-terminal domain
VHNRASYTADEIVWGARFLPILNEDGSGVPANVVERLNRFEMLGSTSQSGQTAALTT